MGIADRAQDSLKRAKATGEKLLELHQGHRGAVDPATDGHPGHTPTAHNFGTVSALDLCAQDFAPVQWAVPGILPAGVSLLAGAPKTGKSWMALDFALAVAGGNSVLGKVQVDPGTVLYLALEDNQRRLKSRILKRLAGSLPPANLYFQTEWARLDQGAADRLREWMECHPDTRLIIVDTLARIRPPSNGKKTLYAEDYDIGKPLLKVAAEYGVAILLVHHTKKGEADDPLELVSGSFGLSGGVDNVLVLQRNRGTSEASLYVTGRDIEHETKYGLEWDSQIAAWTVQGEGPHVGLSPERRKVYDIIATHGPINGKDITCLLNPGVPISRDSKEWVSVRKVTGALKKAGLIQETPQGLTLILEGTHSTQGTHSTRGTQGTHSEGRESCTHGPVHVEGVYPQQEKAGYTPEAANGAGFDECVPRVPRVPCDSISDEGAHQRPHHAAVAPKESAWPVWNPKPGSLEGMAAPLGVSDGVSGVSAWPDPLPLGEPFGAAAGAGAGAGAAKFAQDSANEPPPGAGLEDDWAEF